LPFVGPDRAPLQLDNSKEVAGFAKYGRRDVVNRNAG
jgi:hypothetical protein